MTESMQQQRRAEWETMLTCIRAAGRQPDTAFLRLRDDFITGRLAPFYLWKLTKDKGYALERLQETSSAV